jgi:hypothetical protein
MGGKISLYMLVYQDATRFSLDKLGNNCKIIVKNFLFIDLET